MLLIHERLRGEGAHDDTLTLPWDRRQKARQRVVLDSGREAGVILPPGAPGLRAGERLRDDAGGVILVRATHELVTTAHTGDPLKLARACYHLGNRHVPVQVGPGWVRYLHDHVLDRMVVQLGLRIRGERLGFEPEAGAYAGHGHAHAPDGDHGHGHPHDHGHDHGHGADDHTRAPGHDHAHAH